MKIVLRTIAFGAALAVAGTAIPSVAAMTFAGVQDQDRDHDQAQRHSDYSNNSFYKLGNSEGYQDYKSGKQRKEHNHKYRNDDDRQAHDYGYQQGLQGHNGYHSDASSYHNDNNVSH
jgi:hypothetical protein